MNEDLKAAAERTWNTLKADVDTLAAKITALYQATGSTRQCRHINELWHPENAAVGIGFVPPEAREHLEPLIERAGLSLHKNNGPLGKGVYFSLLNNDRLTPARLSQLSNLVETKTLEFKDAPPPAPKPAASAEYLAEEQVARVEGLTVVKGDRLRSRPAQVSTIVDAFNGATEMMKPIEVIQYLQTAITYFEYLPDISRRELLRTLAMMEDAEKKVTQQKP